MIVVVDFVAVDIDAHNVFVVVETLLIRRRIPSQIFQVVIDGVTTLIEIEKQLEAGKDRMFHFQTLKHNVVTI